MDFDRCSIVYFDCDQRGRRTRCESNCGFKNSSGTFERPFVIMSLKTWNKNIKNDGIYVLPITSKLGNAYSLTLGSDIILDKNLINFKDSKVLCDKLCRVSEKDLSKGTNSSIKINYSEFKLISKKVNEALTQSGVFV